MAEQGWCTIESDPGVFTELLEKFGVDGVQVEELYSFDRVPQLGQIFGFIFLFKWDKDLIVRPDCLDVVPEGLFYAKQVINNACASQALLSILLNRPDIEIGDMLSGFKSFTTGMKPEDIGQALGSHPDIREAHNSFRRPEPIAVELTRNPDEGEDAFHFISYVPFNGFLYEIDGLQVGPRIVGECTDETWAMMAQGEMEARMQEYSGGEIRFNLLSIVRDLREVYAQELSEIMVNEGTEERQEFLGELIQEEELKRERWTRENNLRRHNYFPFIFGVLEHMARKNLLQQAEDKANTKKQARKAEKQKQEEAGKAKASAAASTTTTTSATE